MHAYETYLNSILSELAEKLPKFPDGRINYSNSDIRPVLTCFVKYKDKILLLKRSAKVGTEAGLWCAVSGYIDQFVPVEEKALEELREELNVTKDIIKEIKVAEPYELISEVTWIIFPVLVELNAEPAITIDWEHTEYRWIEPSEMGKYETVPDLVNTLARVLECR